MAVRTVWRTHGDNAATSPDTPNTPINNTSIDPLFPQFEGRSAVVLVGSRSSQLTQSLATVYHDGLPGL